MADSEPAVYSAPVAPGLVAATMPLPAFLTTRFLPAPRVHEAW